MQIANSVSSPRSDPVTITSTPSSQIVIARDEHLMPDELF